MIGNTRKKDNHLADDLWREYEPYIRKLCNYKLSSHKEYIDDCVQDVFTALVEALHKGVTIEYPKTWLTSVANNKIKDIYGKAKKTSENIISLSDREMIDEQHFSEDLFDEYGNISEEQILQIKDEIIQKLDESEQLLLYERFELRISISDIAKKYNTTENNIYQRLFRLKSKTKKLIKEYFK